MLKKLSEIASVGAGQTFRAKAESAVGDVRLLQIKDIREGYFSDIQKLPFASISSDILKINLSTDDIVLPLRGDRVAAMILKNDEKYFITTTNQVAVITVNKEIVLPEYVMYYINSSEGKRKISELKSGGLISNLSIKLLSIIEIPVPTFDIQRKVLSLYNNWISQKDIMYEMIENGDGLCESVCRKLISGK